MLLSGRFWSEAGCGGADRGGGGGQVRSMFFVYNKPFKLSVTADKNEQKNI